MSYKIAFIIYEYSKINVLEKMIFMYFNIRLRVLQTLDGQTTFNFLNRFTNFTWHVILFLNCITSKFLKTHWSFLAIYRKTNKTFYLYFSILFKVMLIKWNYDDKPLNKN